jgi:hypothetical protein
MNIAPLAVYLVLGSTGRQLHRRDLHHERAGDETAGTAASARPQGDDCCHARHAEWERDRASPAIRWDLTSMSRRVRSKFLGILHIRNAEELASFRQRDPRISQARIIFALLGIVCLLCQRCAPGGRFPCRSTFGSHLVVSNLGMAPLPELSTPTSSPHIPLRRVVVTHCAR